MPTIIGYATDGLVYSAETNSWRLTSGYDPAAHRVEFQISDDDWYLDGDDASDAIDDDDDFDDIDDEDTDEVGEDDNQTADVYDMEGNLIKSGQVYSEEYYVLSTSEGEVIFIDRIEIDGVHVGYTASAPLQAGVSYRLNTTYNTDMENAGDYDFFSAIPCFGPKTRITTDRGEIPVAWLRRGDKILTKDDGYVPLRWIGRARVQARAMQIDPRLAPVRVSASLVNGAGAPGYVDLSPEHRILFTGADVQMLFGVDEVFAAAKYFAEPKQPVGRLGGYTYFHLLFYKHRIVRANGLWSESLLVVPQENRVFSQNGITPPLGIHHKVTSRPCLTREQAEMLVALRRNELEQKMAKTALGKNGKAA